MILTQRGKILQNTDPPLWKYGTCVINKNYLPCLLQTYFLQLIFHDYSDTIKCLRSTLLLMSHSRKTPVSSTFFLLSVIPLGWLQRQVSYSAEAFKWTIHTRNAGVYSNSWWTICPTYPLTVAIHLAQTRQKVWLAALHVSNVLMLTMDVQVPLQNACPQALISNFGTIKHSCTVQNGKASRSQWTYKEC